jgi:hypothetical protein
MTFVVPCLKLMADDNMYVAPDHVVCLGLHDLIDG